MKYMFPVPKGSRGHEIRKRNKKDMAKRPDPKLPPNVPQDFLDALHFKGTCAIPVWGDNKWSFWVIHDGGPVIDQRTGKNVRFETYKEAAQAIKGFSVYLKEKSKIKKSKP